MVKRLFFRGAPLLTVLLFVSIVSMPIQITGYSTTAPFLAFPTLCYWSIFAPTVLPFYALFFLGLLQDILSNPDILGLNAGLFLLARMLLELEQRFFVNQGFVALCLTLAAVSFAFFLLKTIITFFLASAPFSLMPFVLQYIFTFFLLPPLIWSLIHLRNFLARRNLL